MKTTLQELVDFFKGKVKGSDEEVLKWCVVGFHEGTLLCIKDEEGNIIGGVTGYLENPTTIFVTLIYATNKLAMDNMIYHLQRLYPKFSLKARRHGRIVEYNTEKLKTKILKIWKTINS